jgi:ketosteroid isomerase-like protein
MTEQTDSESIIRKYVAALQAGDTDMIRKSFAEDATWTIRAGRLPISGTWTGRDAIIDEFLAEAMAHYEPGSISLEITGMIAEGDRVVLEWTSRARTREGRTYENGCIGVFTISAGKIQRVREYMDTLYASEVAFTGSKSPRAASAGGR